MTQDNKALVKVEQNLATLGTMAEQAARETIAVASAQARVLAEIIETRGLYTTIGNNKHVEIEGWELAATFRHLGVGVDKTEDVRDAAGEIIGYKAHAIVRSTETGAIVSEAWHRCMLSEAKWKGKPLFNLESMAGTRACSKALRMCLSWVMVLGGYAPTPAEEMEGVKVDKPAPQEAPRGEAPATIACDQCRYRPMLESKFEKGKYYHYTDEVDAETGKKLTHTQYAKKPADAPARAPAAPAKVVDSTSRPAPTGGVPDPGNMGEVMQLAKARKGMWSKDVLAFFMVKKAEEIRITPAEAWAKIDRERPDVAGAPLFPPKE